MWAVHEDFDVKKHLFRARVIWGSSIAVLWRAIELLGNNHRVLKTYIYINIYIYLEAETFRIIHLYENCCFNWMIPILYIGSFTKQL